MLLQPVRSGHTACTVEWHAVLSWSSGCRPAATAATPPALNRGECCAGEVQPCGWETRQPQRRLARPGHYCNEARGMKAAAPSCWERAELSVRRQSSEHCLRAMRPAWSLAASS